MNDVSIEGVKPMQAATNDTSIERRFAFVGYDDKDRRNAADIWRLLEDELDGILRLFYANVQKNPDAPRIDSERIACLVSAQKLHWQRLLIENHQPSYADSVRRVGATHHRLHIEPRWYIAGYAMIINRIIRVLADKLAGDAAHLTELICTLNRHVAIDIDLALAAYTSHLVD